MLGVRLALFTSINFTALKLTITPVILYKQPQELTNQNFEILEIG
jgi:hypothetical protein